MKSFLLRNALAVIGTTYSSKGAHRSLTTFANILVSSIVPYKNVEITRPVGKSALSGI